MERKIRVGVIGTGAIAQIAELPSLVSIPEVEISAILSGHYENAVMAAARYGANAAVHNLDEFLNQNLDCAFLLTPKTIRKEFLLPLLDAGLHVFCEKPLSMTLKECDYLADLSAKSRQIIMVGFNRRFAPVYQRGIAAFEGEKPEYVFAGKSREFKEYRGTLENAIHMVDLLRWYCGECIRVEAQARFTDPFYEDLCTAQLSFENGSIGLLGASRHAGQWVERVEMHGGGKSVNIDFPEGYRVIYSDHEYQQQLTPLANGCATAQDRMGFLPCVQHFIDCVKTGAKPLTSAEDAYKTHELMDRILRTAGLPDLSQEWD